MVDPLYITPKVGYRLLLICKASKISVVIRVRRAFKGSTHQSKDISERKIGQAFRNDTESKTTIIFRSNSKHVF